MNPTNVRGGSALRNSASVSSFHLITEAASAAGVVAAVAASGGGGGGGGGGRIGGTSLSRSHSMRTSRRPNTATSDDLLV